MTVKIVYLSIVFPLVPYVYSLLMSNTYPQYTGSLPLSGMVVCTSQLNTTERTWVAAVVRRLGGDYQQVLSKKCTHLVLHRPEGVCVISTVAVGY